MSQKTTIETFGLFLGLAAIVAVMPFVWSISPRGESRSRAGLEVGATLPTINGVGWINGSAPKADELKGKVVVVNAWADFCPKCHQGMPALVETYHRFHGSDVVFIGMTNDDEGKLDDINSYIRKYKVEWPNVYGAEKSLIAFKAEYIPGYWVIGRDGKVVWNKDNESERSMESAIKEALQATVAPESVGS